MSSLGRAIHTRLISEPERIALVVHAATSPVRMTAGEFDRRARQWAARLVAHRRVAIAADNGLPLAVALLGAIYAGVAVVPLYAGTPRADLLARLARFGIDLVLSDRSLELVPFGEGAAVACCSLSAIMDEAPLAEPVEVAPAAPQLLLQTSGTTGQPRAVVISAGALASHLMTLADGPHAVLGLGRTDRVLATLPLAHSFGCRMAFLAPLLAGAEVHVVTRFSAHATLEILAAERITWAPVVPTMLSAWVAVEGAPPGALAWVLSAGAPLPDALALEAEARLGCDVRQGYGLTEASFSTLDAPPSPRALGTVGRPVPGVEVRLDPASGEVLVRGPNLMSGYLDEPEASAAAMPDGWLATGDLGAWEGESLRLIDRLKDIILRGGHTIHPAEVEAVLASHPQVAAAAVVGRPHPHLGEEVVAHVVPRPFETMDPVALTAWSSARLAAYKVPTLFFTEAELPLGPSGKVLKRALRSRHRLPGSPPGK